MDVLIKQTNGLIETNFEEAKAYLAAQTEAYTKLVFTEDTKKDAKDTVAQLRKDKKSLQDRVKQVSDEYMVPLNEFKAKANELIGLYDVPISAINEQIEAFEAKRIEEKRAAIAEYYNEIVPEDEWREVIPLDVIYNKKWENATTSAKAIKEEIMQRKTDAKAAYSAIKAMHSDKEDEALAMYRKNFNLTEVIDHINRYEEYKREIAEQERIKAEREAEERRIKEQREAEERIRAEERAKIEAEQAHQRELEEAERQKRAELEALEAQKQQEVAEAQAEAIEAFIPEDIEEPAEDYSYTITLTKDAKEKLEMFMDSVGIEYELIEF